MAVLVHDEKAGEFDKSVPLTVIRGFFSAIPSAAWLLISVVILILLFKTFAEGLFPLCLRSMIQTFFVRFRTT